MPSHADRGNIGAGVTIFKGGGSPRENSCDASTKLAFRVGTFDFDLGLFDSRSYTYFFRTVVKGARFTSLFRGQEHHEILQTLS